jgi:excisionase family DNA binding protein
MWGDYMQDKIKKFMTEKELCEILQISTKTVYRYRKDKNLPHIKIGNSIRYDVDEIKNWLEQNKNK